MTATIKNIEKKIASDGSAGFSLIDLLAAVSLLAIILVAVNVNAVMTYTAFGKLTREAISLELAQDKLEQLAAIDPTALDDSFDSLEMGLMVEGMEFLRQVDVTVGPNAIRTVQVRVQAVGGRMPVETIIETSLAPRKAI